ncbi:MAG: bile acid:sodium symporter, partial [Bradyrhizobium sp.]
MTISRLRSFAPVDPYIAAIVGMVGLATLLPLHGQGTVIGGYAADVAIALLFFLHGARLSTTEALVGARHWKLHLVIFLSTFALFPLLGLAAHALAPHLLTPALWAGVILICILPSTVQSSVAFTSIAHGNVSAALCSATASKLLGIVATPLLAGVLLSSHGGFSGNAALDIVVQLLLPFAAGQLSRPLIGGFVARHHAVLGLVD